jgi:hypothetical protein
MNIDAQKAIEKASEPVFVDQPDAFEMCQEAQKQSALHHYVFSIDS